MDIKITEKREEPLLSRTTIKADISFKGATPSKEEIKKSLASSLKADGKLIAVKNIFTSFGLEKAAVTACQYSDEKFMKIVEKEKKPKAGKGKAPEKEEEAKPEEKKEEKKAPKKEAPKEEKPKTGEKK